MGKIWIMVCGEGEAAALSSIVDCGAAELGALVVGGQELAEEAARAAAEVKWIDDAGAPAECYAQAVAELMSAEGAQLAVGVADPGTRAAFGLWAQQAGGAVSSNVCACSLEGDEVAFERLSTGDRIVQSVTAQAPAALLINPLLVSPEALCEQDAGGLIERVEAAASGVVEVAGSEPAPSSDVETAERVVGVGRGVKDHESFDRTRQLADALGAKMSCTMPIHTDFDYLDDSAYYIGRSGLKISPRLYVALGISGTSQHLDGLRNAKTIVVVNKDPKAKFFDHADYGIVGDVDEIVPELVKALG